MHIDQRIHSARPLVQPRSKDAVAAIRFTGKTIGPTQKWIRAAKRRRLASACGRGGDIGRNIFQVLQQWQAIVLHWNEPALQAEAGTALGENKLSTKSTIVFRVRLQLESPYLRHYAKNTTVHRKSRSVSQNRNNIRGGEQMRVQRGEGEVSIICAACLRPARKSGEICVEHRPDLLTALFVAGNKTVPANQYTSDTCKPDKSRTNTANMCAIVP